VTYSKLSIPPYTKYGGIKTVKQEKRENRNRQKSVKSVQLMGVGVYGGKDFWKKIHS